MFTALRKFFRDPYYEGDPDQAQDVRTTHRVTVALLGLGLLSIPFMFDLERPIRDYTILGTVSGLFIWLFTIFLIKRGRIISAKVIILTVNSLNLLVVVYFAGGLERPTIFATIFLVALAALLFPKRGTLIYGAILLVLSTGLFALGQIGLTPEPAYSAKDTSIFSIFAFTLIAVTVLLEIVSVNIRHNLENALLVQSQLRKRNLELDELRGQLEVRVEERTQELKGRTEQLEAIADVARSIATIKDIDHLLPEITKLVSERFGFYHVGIFLLDEIKQFAILRAANSDGGQKMLARGHRLGVGQQGIVGYVTSRGQARVALDVGEEAVYFNNPDLPETHSEVALPLMFGQEIIGALDIQSTDKNAFSQDNVKIFSILADQVSVAIQNVQSLSQMQRALHEADRATRQLTGQGWKMFSERTKVKGIHFDGSKSRLLEEAPRAAEKGILRIPIQIRGLEIASLNLESPNPNHHWLDDEIAIAKAAAERTALALENARLLEEAQHRASREQAISEMTASISAFNDVDTILRTVVQELGNKIGNTEVIFELSSEHNAQQEALK
jgi:GAF domain-containing protein